MPGSASTQELKSHAAVPHFHAIGDACPLCEQPIPYDRFEEIKGRIESRQREERLEAEAQFQERLTEEKASAVQHARSEARAELDRERQQFQMREATAREEGRLAGEAAAATERDLLLARANEAEAAKANAEQSARAFKSKIEEVRREGEAAVHKANSDATARELLIREEAQRQAAVSAEERIAGINRAHQESERNFIFRIKAAEDARSAADQSVAGLQRRVQEITEQSQAEVEKVRLAAESQLNVARKEAAATAEAGMHDRVAAAERAKEDAEAKSAAAVQQAESLKKDHQAEVTRQLQEQREVLEQDKTVAVNAERAANFEKELKWTNKVEELQRALANKTADELGDGAEIDLYETLKRQFEGDRIGRINKGQPGADILHVVIHNGQECGKILYDSKNHNAWRNEFATKLAEDQLAAKADHAILSTRKFPKGARELHIQDGVILAGPARVATLAQIVRQHVVTSHALRLSNEEKTNKTNELYTFINSGRCRDLFNRIDANAEKLLNLQLKEKRAHETMWKNQGEIVRSIQKAQAEVTNEIDLIIGTSASFDDVEEAVSE